MRLPRTLLVVPATLLLVALFAVPVLFIVRTSLFDPGFTSEHFVRFFERGAYLRVLGSTVQVSLVVAFACLAIGYPTAWFIAHRPPRWRPVLLFLVLVPMWMSILIRTYAWMVVLGREGVVNAALQGLGLVDEPVKLIFTSAAVHVAMVQILLPIMVLTCFSTMGSIDGSLVRAARTLGAGPFSAFRHVYWPLSLPGAVSGTMIVFILSLGFFITPALLGGRRDTMLANLIAGQVERGNWGFAGAMSMVLLAVALVVIGIVAIASRRWTYDASEQPR